MLRRIKLIAAFLLLSVLCGCGSPGVESVEVNDPLSEKAVEDYASAELEKALGMQVLARVTAVHDLKVVFSNGTIDGADPYEQEFTVAGGHSYKVYFVSYDFSVSGEAYYKDGYTVHYKKKSDERVKPEFHYYVDKK